MCFRTEEFSEYLPRYISRNMIPRFHFHLSLVFSLGFWVLFLFRFILCHITFMRMNVFPEKEYKSFPLAQLMVLR